MSTTLRSSSSNNWNTLVSVSSSSFFVMMSLSICESIPCKPRLLSDGMVLFDLTIYSYCSLQEVLDPTIYSYLSLLIQVERAKGVELQTKRRFCVVDAQHVCTVLLQFI